MHQSWCMFRPTGLNQPEEGLGPGGPEILKQNYRDRPDGSDSHPRFRGDDWRGVSNARRAAEPAVQKSRGRPTKPTCPAKVWMSSTWWLHTMILLKRPWQTLLSQLHCRWIQRTQHNVICIHIYICMHDKSSKTPTGRDNRMAQVGRQCGPVWLKLYSCVVVVYLRRPRGE